MLPHSLLTWLILNMMITLICGDQKKKFSVRQAESILWIQGQMKKGDWKLPDDCPYEYIDNALRKRANTKDCKEPAKKRSVSKGGEPRSEVEIPHGDDTK